MGRTRSTTTAGDQTTPWLTGFGCGPGDCIFRDQMATAAAIDRLAHHVVLLDFDVTSYRTV